MQNADAESAARHAGPTTRAMAAMDENTKATATDQVLAEYHAELENKQCVADDLSTNLFEELSTAQLLVERTTTVGPTK